MRRTLVPSARGALQFRRPAPTRVDDHRGDPVSCDQATQLLELADYVVGSLEGHVGFPIGQQHEPRVQRWVPAPLLRDHLPGSQEPMRQGRGAADRKCLETLAGEPGAPGGRQQHGGHLAAEDDDTDSVSALVGAQQQGEDGALGRGHPCVGAHGIRGVDHEYDEEPGREEPELLAQVFAGQAWSRE